MNDPSQRTRLLSVQMAMTGKYLHTALHTTQAVRAEAEPSYENWGERRIFKTADSPLPHFQGSDNRFNDPQHYRLSMWPSFTFYLLFNNSTNIF